MKYKVGDRVIMKVRCQHALCWDSDCERTILNKVGIIEEILVWQPEGRIYRVGFINGERCKFREEQLVLDVGIQMNMSEYGITKWCRQYYK